MLTSQNSAIDVAEVVDTRLYDANDFKDVANLVVELGEVQECCKLATSRGESACCRRARTHETSLSKVMTGSEKLPQTRHEARFGIKSFCYMARRPFHPHRFMKDFVEKYFIFIDNVDPSSASEAGGEEEDVGTGGGDESDEDPVEVRIRGYQDEMKRLQAKLDDALKARPGGREREGEETEGEDEDEDEEATILRKQTEAQEKQKLRESSIGHVLRSKGFIWTAHTHDLLGTLSQAGNTLSIQCDGHWDVLDVNAWEGTDDEKAKLRKGFVDPWGDRRQELVFIGYEMDHAAIQKALDACLLTDDEFTHGIDYWKATMGDVLLFGEHIIGKD